MRLYFASNIGGGERKYEICFIAGGVRNRLFSFHYHEGASGLELYFAGNGKGGGDVKDDVYINAVYKNVNKLFSFFRDKKLMELYFAGGENKCWLKAIEEAGGEEALYSYYFLLRDNGSKAEDFLKQALVSQKKVFLDSGGFSAFTKGVKIDIYEYIDFIKKIEDKITAYAVLDVIGDPVATAKNQGIMEEAGLNPVPVFHAFSDLKYLEDMVSKYDYIALGGLVPLARDKRRLAAWLDRCFSVIKNGARVHGFGMTSFDMMMRYPFYSVDSTSWLGGSMRAEVYKFSGTAIKASSTSKRDEATLDTIGFTDDGDKRWMARVVKNAIEWMKAERHITEVWRRRGVVWDD